MSENPNFIERPTYLSDSDLPSEASGERLWRVSITLLVFAALIFITSRTIVDADLWGHLRFGLDNIQAGSVAQVDPYSYLSLGQRWINHEWLTEVVFALAWLAGGSTGLILMKTTVGVLTLGLIYWYLLRLKISPTLAGSLVILGWFGLMTAITTVRPQMFTLLFTAILFIVLAKAESDQYRWLWAAPPVFLLWINFHGGVLAGLGFLGIWTIMHLGLHRQEWRSILPPVILSVMAVLVNPYGLDMVTFLFRTATIPRPEIFEWQPIKLVSLLGGIYLVLLVIAILGLAYSKRKKEVPIMALLAAAALLPFVAFRHLPLFALAVLVFGGPYIDDAWSQINPNQQVQSKRPCWISVISLIVALGLSVWSFSNFQRIVIPKPFFPDRAVMLIAESQVAGNLAVDFNWGQYVIWHLGPDVQVSMDGRRETVYSDEIYQMYRDFVNGARDWDAVLDNYDTRMALVYQSQSAYNLMKLKSGWEIIYEDDTSALFAKHDWSEFNKIKDAGKDFIPGSDNDYFP